MDSNGRSVSKESNTYNNVTILQISLAYHIFQNAVVYMYILTGIY